MRVRLGDKEREHRLNPFESFTRETQASKQASKQKKRNTLITQQATEARKQPPTTTLDSSSNGSCRPRLSVSCVLCLVFIKHVCGVSQQGGGMGAQAKEEGEGPPMGRKEKTAWGRRRHRDGGA